MNKVHFFELSELISNGAILIDLREYNEFQKYHIPSSISIHTQPRLPINKPIIFICNYGYQAKEYATMYHQYYLEGGISRYIEMTKPQTFF